MKITCLLVSFFLLSKCLAQQDLQIKCSPINTDLAGSSVRVDIRKEYNKTVAYLGLGYLINPPHNSKDYNAAFANKAWAANILQHFIFNFGIERSVRIKEGQVRFFPFIEFAVSYTGLKIESYDLLLEKGINYIYVTNRVFPKTNALWVINHTGIGCDFPIFNKIRLSQQLGLSPAYIMVKDKQSGLTFHYIGQGIIQPFYNIGISYKIK